MIIAISVPAALYSVIPIKTEKSSTTEPSSTTEQTAKKECLTESTIVVREVKKALVKTRESNNVYYIFAVFITAPFLDVSIIGLNVWLLVNCNFTWFILCFDIVFIALSIFEVGWISALAYYNRDELDTRRAHILYAAGIFSLVVALQLLTFHGTFILLVFIFSPIPTACFTLIYISALFSMLMAVSIVIKVIHKYYKGDIRGKKCHYTFQITVAILFVFFVLPLDALFFTMLARAQLDYFGVGSFFGTLVPTTIVSLIFFIGNMLSENDDVKPNRMTENEEGDSYTGENNEKESLVKDDPNTSSQKMYGSTSIIIQEPA